jgi:hypothetical protein
MLCLHRHRAQLFEIRIGREVVKMHDVWNRRCDRVGEPGECLDPWN